MENVYSGLSAFLLAFLLSACGASSTDSSNSAQSDDSNSDNSGSSSGGTGSSSGVSQALPLTASAGLDQVADEQSVVLLTADANLADTSFQWQQISGSEVEINGANSANASFIAPQTSNNEALIFELTAVLADQQVVDQVVINITNLIDAPQNIAASIALSGQLIVDWSEVEEADSYNLYYAPSTPAGIALGAAGVSETLNVTSPVTISNLINDQSYTLAITAVDVSGNESVLSMQASNTPLAAPESVVCEGDLNQNYNISTVAGNGYQGFLLGSDATSSIIGNVSDVVLDNQQNLFMTLGVNRVLKVNLPTNAISVIAGSGLTGTNGDGGPASAAVTSSLAGINTDANGNVYIVSRGNHNVRMIDQVTGIINRYAGTGGVGASGDGGMSVAAKLRSPERVRFDAAGHGYIIDRSNHAIRRVDKTTGIISTIAGSSYQSGSDNTHLFYPTDLAFAANGEIYVADEFNFQVRKINPTTGIISPFAGSGVQGFAGDNGTAANAQFDYLSSMLIDSVGNLVVADLGNNRIRLIEAETGIVKTIAGNGVAGFGGDDGLATLAQIRPEGLACSDGKIYIADGGNARVRMLTPIQP